MSDMTPWQARGELASGFPTRTPEYILDRAIRALETIAAMREEWGVTAQIGASRIILRSAATGSAFDSRGSWFPTKEAAERFMENVTATDPQIVRRYVTQVIDGE